MVRHTPAETSTSSSAPSCSRHISPWPVTKYQISSTVRCRTARDVCPGASSKWAMPPPSSPSSTRTSDPSGATLERSTGSRIDLKGCIAVSFMTPVGATWRSVADAWVQDRVCDVSQQVEQHGKDGDQHHHPENQRVVAVGRSLKGKQPHAWPAEDALDDDGPAHELRHLQRKQGDDGQDCVAQRVPVVDGSSVESFCPSRPHIVEVQDLEHPCPEEPAEARDVEYRKRGARQGHVPHEIGKARVVGAGVHAKQREIQKVARDVPKPHPSQKKQKNSDHETGG